MSSLGKTNKRAGQSLEENRKLGLLPELCNNAPGGHKVTAGRFSCHKMEQHARGKLQAAVNIIDGWREDKREGCSAA